MTYPPYEWLGIRLAQAARFLPDGSTFVDARSAASRRDEYLAHGGSEGHLTGLLTEFGHNDPNATAKELLS
jgi:hypothetical protein